MLQMKPIIIYSVILLLVGHFSYQILADESEKKLLCYKCDSSPNCAYINETSDTIDCSTECFTIFDSNGNVKRGCLSEAVNCQEPTCIKCREKKCNNQNAKTTTQSTTSPAEPQTVPANATTASQTVSTTEAPTVSSTEAPTVSSTEAPTVVFTCIRCNSDMQPNCKKEAKKLIGTKCKNEKLAEEQKECYTGVWNDVVIRGCLADADDRQKLVCTDKNNHQCEICKGKDCNTEETSGVASLKIAGSILVVAMTFLLLFY